MTIFCFMLPHAPNFGECRCQSKDRAAFQGNADAGAVFKLAPGQQAEAHSEVHSFRAVIAARLFSFLFSAYTVSGETSPTRTP